MKWIDLDPPVCVDPYCDENVIYADEPPPCLRPGVQVRFANGHEFIVGDLTETARDAGCACCARYPGRGAFDGEDEHVHGHKIVAYRNLIPEEES